MKVTAERRLFGKYRIFSQEKLAQHKRAFEAKVNAGKCCLNKTYSIQSRTQSHNCNDKLQWNEWRRPKGPCSLQVKSPDSRTTVCLGILRLLFQLRALSHVVYLFVPLFPPRSGEEGILNITHCTVKNKLMYWRTKRFLVPTDPAGLGCELSKEKVTKASNASEGNQQIFEIVDYDVTDGQTDLRLFAVLASLAPKNSSSE
ncbi:hypothetical protein H920_08316 [Fukomys damarensis]|uniref:Uncharacterized protein n=1 Tax=Fukomys damarensis TaxID=885580 RepID=A0A091DJ47_FUKDA|nr:hypothetical protein H920_08316 [Fukomys damarensis]